MIYGYINELIAIYLKKFDSNQIPAPSTLRFKSVLRLQEKKNPDLNMSLF